MTPEVTLVLFFARMNLNARVTALQSQERLVGQYVTEAERATGPELVSAVAVLDELRFVREAIYVLAGYRDSVLASLPPGVTSHLPYSVPGRMAGMEEAVKVRRAELAAGRNVRADSTG